MLVKTKYFDEVEIADDKVITLVHPIYGFEEYHHFIMLNDTEIGEEFTWFQSLDDKDICFVMANLGYSIPSYQPSLPEEIIKLLDVKSVEDDLYYFGIMVIQDNFQESTINLKSPVVINHNTHTGAQVILDEDFPLRKRISELEGED